MDFNAVCNVSEIRAGSIPEEKIDVCVAIIFSPRGFFNEGPLSRVTPRYFTPEEVGLRFAYNIAAVL